MANATFQLSYIAPVALNLADEALSAPQACPSPASSRVRSSLHPRAKGWLDGAASGGVPRRAGDHRLGSRSGAAGFDGARDRVSPAPARRRGELRGGVG